MNCFDQLFNLILGNNVQVNQEFVQS